MCMITLVPANVELPEDGIYNGSITNDDGHGFAIASKEHGLEVFKSMKYFETWRALESKREKHGPGSVVLFHSRFGTHGELGEYNVHPFALNEHTVMAHNGIMPSGFHPLNGDRRSDTRIFADWIAKWYCENENGLPSRRGAKKLAKLIGGGNKLVFLSVKTGAPKVRIVNAHLGDHNNGVWYSNSGYRWASSSRWSSTSWWGDDDGWYRGTTARRLYTPGHWDSKEKRWVPGVEIEPELPEGIVECPMCGHDVDESAMLCLDCDYCLDCQDYLDNCMCYLPGHVSRERDRTEIIQIEDVADRGYVKVDGVWRLSESLLDSRNDTTGIAVR